MYLTAAQHWPEVARAHGETAASIRPGAPAPAPTAAPPRARRPPSHRLCPFCVGLRARQMLVPN
jgi:hypothetical protein